MDATLARAARDCQGRGPRPARDRAAREQVRKARVRGELHIVCMQTEHFFDELRSTRNASSCAELRANGTITVVSAWPRNAEEATLLQERLARFVEREDRLPELRTVAGADLSSPANSNRVHGAVVVLDLPGLTVREVALAQTEATFPYIPGLLAFRELHPILAVWKRLKAPADLLVVDGHGVCHPRRFGIACHLGLELDIPTIGCGKTPYVGEQAGALADEAGATAPIVDQGEVVAMALRTRKGSKPVYVSIGHRVSLETAVELVRSTCDGARVPAPTREAHVWANKARRGEVPLTPGA